MTSVLDTLGSFGLFWKKKGLGNTDTIITTAEKELNALLGLAAISQDPEEVAQLLIRAKAQEELIRVRREQKDNEPGLLLPPGLFSSDSK